MSYIRLFTDRQNKHNELFCCYTRGHNKRTTLTNKSFLFLLLLPLCISFVVFALERCFEFFSS